MEKKKSLSETEYKELIAILKDNFINLYRILLEVDPKEGDLFQKQNQYYHDKIDGAHHNCKDTMNKFFIPESEMTYCQKILYEMTKDYKLKETLPPILDELYKKYQNIKKGGIKDNLEWNKETEKFVLTQVLTQGIVHMFAKEMRSQLTKENFVDSKQPLLLATPNAWYEKFPKIKLDFLLPDSIKSLIERGFAIQKKFIEESDFPKMLHNEVIYFYHEGRFEAPKDEQSRNDRTLSFSLQSLDEKSVKHLYKICVICSALPFELNLKANIICQVSETFQLSYYKTQGFHKAHFDSSFDSSKDNGNKISVIYLISNSSNGKADIKLFEENDINKFEQVEIKSGDILLLKSRVRAYEINNITEGSFLLRYWVNGPSDTKVFHM